MDPEHLTPDSIHPRKRRRLQACERCFKRKQKCDRLLPACTACVEADAQCAPRQLPIGRVADEGNGLSHAAVPNYVETLKKKVEELEGQYRRQSACLKNHTAIDSQPSSTRATTSSEEQGRSDQTPTTVNSHVTERSVQAAMGEIGFLSRNAMAEPRCEIRGFPQAFTMDNMVRASLAISGENPSESSIPSSHSRKLVALMGDVGQLTKELAAPYLDYFIHKIGLMFLYIDPLELRRFFDDHFCEKRSRFNNNSNTGSRVTTPFQDFYVYMAVSIGMLLSSEPCIELFARTLHSAAVEKFSVMLKDRDSLKTLHSIFLLIIYSIYSPSGGSTWHLLGLARNQSVSLRLHREPHPGCGISSEELTSRRNFFWSLYTLDRLVYTSISMIHQRLKLPPSTISCAMDRPFSIQDNDISLQVRQAVLVLVGLEQYLNLKQFPARDSPSISAVDFDFACHMITHARLMSSIRASSPGNPVFHYGNLSYWRDLAKSGTNQVHDGDISSGYVGQLTCRALIHIAQLSRCAVSAGSLIGKTQTIEQDAIGSCQAYIDNEFCRFEKGDFAKSFVDGFDIFAAGVVVICLPLGSRLPGRPGDVSTINKCTALLTSIGERFPAFKILYRVLWALFAVASDGTSSDGMLQDLPDLIPDGMQIMIRDFCRQSHAGI